MRLRGFSLAAAFLLLPACAHAAGSALLQDASHQVTISDHVHGSMMLAPSIFLSPNSPGILNLSSGNPLILQKGVATTGTDAGDFRFDRNANYAGGTHGFVNPALYGNCAVSSGAISFEWCGLFKLDNSSSAADAAENVALYAQSHKRNGGATWALVAELQDHNANPTTPSVTLEFDLQTKGTDTNNARVIQDLWGKTDDGLATVIGNGMRFNTDASTTLTNGLTFQGATISNAAIALGAAQKLCLDGLTCANSISQSAGTTTFKNGGVTALTTSSIGSNVIALNSSGQVTVASGQKLCLDGTTCANYWSQSGGTTSFTTASGAALGITGLSTNMLAATATSFDSTGRSTVASGQKVCLDGATCANYLTQSGGTVTIGATAGGAGTSTVTGLGINTPGVSATNVDASNRLSLAASKTLCLDGATCTYGWTQAAGTISTAANVTASGGVQGSTVTSTGNIVVSTNQKLCLNGSGCSIYIMYNGTSIGFYNGGTSQFQMNMSTGTGGPSGAVTSGVSTGVSCGAGSHQTVGGVTVIC